MNPEQAGGLAGGAERGPSPAHGGALDTGTHVRPLRYATHDIPGIGGVIKQRPEDFLVDELPLYQPCGEGEHIYMLVQKRGMSTLEMVEILARHFRVKTGAIGYAGLKDKHAITRQVVSVHAPGKRMEDFPMITHEKLGVLWADYHTNKLRPGHLTGNRFSIRIRNVRPADVLSTSRVLERLARVGVPNRVGEQRFGMIENNHLVGRGIVSGDFAYAVNELLSPSPLHPQVNAEARALYAAKQYREAAAAFPKGARTERRVLSALASGASPARAIASLDEAVIKFYISAFQSAVFNAVLDERIAAGTLGSLVPGDLAIKHDNLAVFAVDDAVLAETTTAERLARFEISPSGPMWSAGMMRAQGSTDEVERAALINAGVTPEQLAATEARGGVRAEGKRRPLRVPVRDPEVEGGVDEVGAFVRCAFELPRGSFATVVLREIMKSSGELQEDGE